MSDRNALGTLAIILATMTFALGWLCMDPAPEPLPALVIKAEPCLQWADMPMRKAYTAEQIASLCIHQQHDERFHGKQIRSEK